MAAASMNFFASANVSFGRFIINKLNGSLLNENSRG
jgi:hypothetical protein